MPALLYPAARIADFAVSAHLGPEPLASKAGKGFFSTIFSGLRLDRALALEKMDRRAGVVGQDLELNMPGLFDIFFEIHRLIAESGLGFPHPRLESRPQVLFLADDAHPFSAASGRSLDDHRISDAIAPRLRIPSRI